MKGKLSKPTIALHWITGILFIGVIMLGLYVADLPRSPEKFELLGIHKSLGTIILAVALVRIAWRFKEGAIPTTTERSKLQRILEKSVQHLLLLGTLLMPVSGIMMNMGGGRALEVFGYELLAAGDKIQWLGSLGHTIHVIASKVVLVLIVLHILAALKHQLINKDNTLVRMFGR
ncbi:MULTISPECIES: cytochrome b [unclassified Photobacterium]|uniref:cytochrome b n=1 Tax=unclassified Photobacterium TaxID=2628852 RepID=UPI001EDFB2A1|nr:MULTISPECIES: cytochrome b [unclassified Photobacterium]MCG3866083.1 cytochrome b [Photobacterium sp. Ph6]MCG3877624.1 cytochrome b [Photobacterium sp. Ph5]